MGMDTVNNSKASCFFTVKSPIQASIAPPIPTTMFCNKAKFEHLLMTWSVLCDGVTKRSSEEASLMKDNIDLFSLQQVPPKMQIALAMACSIVQQPNFVITDTPSGNKQQDCLKLFGRDRFYTGKSICRCASVIPNNGMCFGKMIGYAEDQCVVWNYGGDIGPIVTEENVAGELYLNMLEIYKKGYNIYNDVLRQQAGIIILKLDKALRNGDDTELSLRTPSMKLRTQLPCSIHHYMTRVSRRLLCRGGGTSGWWGAGGMGRSVSISPGGRLASKGSLVFPYSSTDDSLRLKFANKSVLISCVAKTEEGKINRQQLLLRNGRHSEQRMDPQQPNTKIRNSRTRYTRTASTTKCVKMGSNDSNNQEIEESIDRRNQTVIKANGYATTVATANHKISNGIKMFTQAEKKSSDEAEILKRVRETTFVRLAISVTGNQCMMFKCSRNTGRHKRKGNEKENIQEGGFSTKMKHVHISKILAEDSYGVLQSTYGDLFNEVFIKIELTTELDELTGGERLLYNSFPVDLAMDMRSSSLGCCNKWSNAADTSSPASLSSNECGKWKGLPTTPSATTQEQKARRLLAPVFVSLWQKFTFMEFNVNGTFKIKIFASLVSDRLRSRSSSELENRKQVSEQDQAQCYAAGRRRRSSNWGFTRLLPYDCLLVNAAGREGDYETVAEMTMSRVTASVLHILFLSKRIMKRPCASIIQKRITICYIVELKHVFGEMKEPKALGLETDLHPLVKLKLVSGNHEVNTQYPLGTLLHTSYGMS
ncbi:hypothetical protein C0J52_07687 [Blattella germanica]|nr:hypothetical protein C0J52_07687 [Blattella germanica]